MKKPDDRQLPLAFDPCVEAKGRALPDSAQDVEISQQHSASVFSLVDRKVERDKRETAERVQEVLDLVKHFK